MSCRQTAIAHSNIAFVKYWGKDDVSLNLPSNGSISMNLSNAKTITSVEFNQTYDHDLVYVGNRITTNDILVSRIVSHLDRIRNIAETRLRARVQTVNTFPSSAGIASSASGMAALTMASTRALGLEMDEKALSILARIGSGSACRSIPDGFVEWTKGDSSEDSFAYQLRPETHWDLVDIVLILSSTAKPISSTIGHRLVKDSPFWDARLQSVQARLDVVRQSIIDRDINSLGQAMELEALTMHALTMTSSYTENGYWKSGIFYWTPETLEVIRAVQDWRQEGIPVFFTIDAGPNVHLITEKEYLKKVQTKLLSLQIQNHGREWMSLVNKPSQGSYLVDYVEFDDPLWEGESDESK